MMPGGDRRQGQRVFLCGPLALKLATSGAARRLLRIEENNNRRASTDLFWRGFVVPAKRFGNALISRRYPAASAVHYAAIKRLIEDKLAVLASADRAPASELIDLAPVAQLADLPSVDIDLAFIVGAASCHRLPVSSSHGDFFVGNMVWRNGQLGLIDWDSYRARSSFVLDVVHFHVNILQLQLGGKSWTELVLDEVPRDARVGLLASKFGVSVKGLLLIYALDRTSREIAQEGGVGKLGPAKLAKYVRLSRALCAISDNRCA
jgi:hypothetical protein